MFCLIGNCPSSGSTLLADLLDSTPFTACGPELEIFCNNKLYDFPEYKKNIFKMGEVANIRTTGIYPRWDRLPLFGYSMKTFQKEISESNSLPDFFDHFSKTFLRFRNKQENGIVFEKTPQNINCMSEFLNSHADGWFIVVVRNPLNVYMSLKKRGYGNYASMVTWMISGAQASVFLKHPKVVVIRYEELISKPYEITASLIKKINPQLGVTPQMVEEGYLNNQYRFKNEKGIQSWSAKRESKIINTDSLQHVSESLLNEFSKLPHLKISKSYARLFNLPEVSFNELIEMFGYSNEINQKLKSVEKKSIGSPKYSINDFQKIFMKWFRATRRGNARLRDLLIYFKVVEKTA